MSQLASPLQDAVGASSSQHVDFIGKEFNPLNSPDSISTPLNASDGTHIRFTNASGSINQVNNQSVVNHRWAAALDKLYRRMYAANSDFSSQMLAIFGVAPVEGRGSRVSHIGGYSQILGNYPKTSLATQ